MDVHPGLRCGADGVATTSFPGLPRMNNLHSNDT
jgi:hypothetical protein